jgi:ABC-type lipoprotein export system ATPase subunit
MKYLELKNKIINDKYTEYVYEAFDIQNKEETIVKIPINFAECKTFDWNIGVIYGGSGTGKTSLLKEFGNLIEDNFDNEKPLISNFDFLEPKEATLLLSAMGLSSVPTWLRPFALLSNGEQYRARLAYKVASAKDNQVILIDEFTSVVDRDVAKSMSSAIQKYIRRENKKIILASCHFDIMEWLLPDWTYSPLKGRVERHDYLRQSRPKIELQIFRCRYEAWNIFKQHHYLTSDLSKSSKCYLTLLNDKPVAFNAVLPLPSGTIQNAYRMSRTVVLPDFQGLGLGGAISDYIAKLYKKDGKRFYAKTSNPALWNKRENSNNWRVTGISNSKDVKIVNQRLLEKGYSKIKDAMKFRREAITKSFEFIGDVSDIKEIDLNLLKFKNEVYKDVAQNQIALF